MKIAEVVSVFPPYFGGMGNVCYHNALGLAKLGHDVTVFTSNYPKVRYQYPKEIKVKRLNYLFKFGNAPFLPKLLTLHDYDVIHLHYPFYFGDEIIYFISKIRKIKYVVHYHMDVAGKGIAKWFFAIHRKIVMPFILKGASKIIVSSLDYARSSVLATIPTIEDKIVVIPNGVDVNKFKIRKKSTALLEKYNIGRKEKIILFVGGLDRPHYFKGVNILIKSFANICIKNSRLLIVGDGDLKDTYMQIAKDIGIAHKIIFAGRINDKELPNYFSLCDFLVLPSIDRGEAFGMVLIEAMASGKAVIASNLPGVRSVVSHNNDGLLIKPGDSIDLRNKMEYLLKNTRIRNKFGRNGREKSVRLYSWNVISRKLNKIMATSVK